MKTGLFVALDFPSAAPALALLSALRGLGMHFKVGKELFVAEGPSIVRALREQGNEVFLDLKFHDIPNTVSRAVTASAALGVKWITIHASGGSEMIRAAREAAEQAGPTRPRILAVTVLTSLDDFALKEIGVDHTAAGQVLHLARLSQASGADGVVASVQEAQSIREETGGDFLIVTPGVRPATDRANDQKRVATPREAVEAGANYIVVGRPITAAPDPRAAAERVLADLATS